MEIWINPRCSKCNAATAALDAAGVDYTVRRYLDDPPSRTELDEVLDRLGLDPWDITRISEPVAKEIGLPTLPRDLAHRDEWVTALAAHPVLIQRPIITADDGTTVIGRDPASLDKVIG
ncbi:ArsC/Spx/MgsR family protein [Leekyejoonella antrihumi]|uniref:Arsenate reductase family protein n=1 Tax=Leekyejoonella antrihumi TaxID=1660198 RepID=A0A563E2V7_9MICO|nr:ArsC/Spx/MgsR family protein [Leekyejoonella antrihumi]TWP36224.1 arsenate reductase family protein [Leekyejoonella antrihumi]